ncbi:hypothetical protein ACP4OV_007377 [Aristida adscensionis]
MLVKYCKAMGYEKVDINIVVIGHVDSAAKASTSERLKMNSVDKKDPAGPKTIKAAA